MTTPGEITPPSPAPVTRRRLALLLLLVVVLGGPAVAYLLWSPGEIVRDGRHDRRTNGIWLQHGWLGDDLWFARHQRDKTRFRSDAKVAELAQLLRGHGVRYVYPHLCPCEPRGTIPRVDPEQTERFLEHFTEFQVIPWVGGVFNDHCVPQSPVWRNNFVASVLELLNTHPRLAGVQINIEPMPTGNADYLILLDELRAALPAGKIISIAAYPPPTRWHPVADVHWNEDYFRQVARRADQVVPMMYDTSIRWPKFYEQLMSQWTTQVLTWSGDTPVLLGIPAYDDPGVGYHHPHVENPQHALAGIHAGLGHYQNTSSLPKNYVGIAIYSEWEMTPQDWEIVRKEFEKSPVVK